jgi:AcrR family transcriptional regulator
MTTKTRTRTDAEFLDALADLLIQKGISRLTIGDLADMLHCSRRRLYEVAESKEQIFCVAVEHHFKRLLARGETVAREQPDVALAIAEYLDVGVKASAELSVEFIRDLENAPRARAIFDAHQEARGIKLSELIECGVRKGVFIPCHGLLVSEAVLGAAMRIRETAFLDRAGLTMEEAFKEFYRILLGGLRVS